MNAFSFIANVTVPNPTPRSFSVAAAGLSDATAGRAEVKKLNGYKRLPSLSWIPECVADLG